LKLLIYDAFAFVEGGKNRMYRIRKVTGEDIRSTYEWLSKDPPFPPVT